MEGIAWAFYLPNLYIPLMCASPTKSNLEVLVLVHKYLLSIELFSVIKEYMQTNVLNRVKYVCSK